MDAIELEDDEDAQGQLPEQGRINGAVDGLEKQYDKESDHRVANVDGGLFVFTTVFLSKPLCSP